MGLIQLSAIQNFSSEMERKSHKIYKEKKDFASVILYF